MDELVHSGDEVVGDFEDVDLKGLSQHIVLLLLVELVQVLQLIVEGKYAVIDILTGE